MSRFEGICYDGPWEGRQISYDMPWYRVALVPALGIVDWQEADRFSSLHVTYATYVWQRDLRKWVFDPRK
jgi:hypothetical protein